MKKIVGIFAALMLVLGVVFAQDLSTSSVVASAPNYDLGGPNDPASVDQSITVEIPERVALHVDATEWNLDLDDLGDEACFAVSKEAAAMGTAEEFFSNFAGLAAMNQGDTTSWQDAKPDLISTVNAHGAAMGLYRATSYPAVNIASPENSTIDGDHDKGYVVCFFGKVVQKFANTEWTFNASLNAKNTFSIRGFGHFGMADIRGGSVKGSFVVDEAPFPSVSHELDAGTSSTGGWLDDYILEGFYFDGSEEAGTYDLTVTYTLTGAN